MSTWIRETGRYKMECRIEGDEVHDVAVDVVVEENGRELERVTMKRRNREAAEFVADVNAYTDMLERKHFARFSLGQTEEIERQR